MAESMLDNTKVGIGKGREGGYAIICPKGTDPTSLIDMTKTLADLVSSVTGAASLGYISEDGVTFKTDTDSDDVTEWGGSVVASPLTSYSESASVTFLETRDSVLKAVYGDDNVTTEGGVTTIRHNKNFNAAHVYVFDCVVSDTQVLRSVIPYGVITERDDLQYNNSDLVGYAPTIKCVASSAFDGDGYRQYLYDTTSGETVAVA